MASYARSNQGVVGGLVGLCLLLVGAVAGCSGEAPEPEPSTSQDKLLIGGFCGGGTQCDAGSVCTTVFSHGCPSQGAFGICIPKPPWCPSSTDPVCGCDGETYDNLCKAVQSGTSVVHRGRCAEPPKCDVRGAACPGVGSCVADSHPWWLPPTSQQGSCQCNRVQTCTTGQRFNDDPLVCACEAAPDPCNGVACKRGEICENQGGNAACVPDSCTGVACKNGQVCVVLPDTSASCMPNTCMGVACKNGEQCVVTTDGSAACWPNVCAAVACKNGQSCVVLADGTAACR